MVIGELGNRVIDWRLVRGVHCSHAEYTAKIGLVSEESDESLGWLEFIEAAALLQSDGSLILNQLPDYPIIQ
jgi:hypothetical protein